MGPIEVEAPDGWAIRGRVQGAAAGPPMLLCNGMICTTHYWPLWTRAFGPRFRIATWDYRGHGGDAVPPIDSIGVASFASDGIALLEKVSRPGEKAIIVGHSMGVQVALEIYGQAPDRVSALILLCGTYGHPLSVLSDSPALRAAVARIARFLRDHPPRALEDRLKPLLRKPWAVEGAYLSKAAVRGRSTEGMIRELLEHVAAMDWRVFYAILADYVEHTAFSILPRVRVPALMIGGGLDGWTPPRKSEEMARAIPGGELMVLAECSHLALVEEPGRVHGRVERFLDAHGLGREAKRRGGR